MAPRRAANDYGSINVDEESVPLDGPTKIHQSKSKWLCLIAAGLVAAALVAGIVQGYSS